MTQKQTRIQRESKDNRQTTNCQSHESKKRFEIKMGEPVTGSGTERLITKFTKIQNQNHIQKAPDQKSKSKTTEKGHPRITRHSKCDGESESI